MYNEEEILNHYKKEAEKHGASNSSTMQDEIIREKELSLILKFLNEKTDTQSNILDLGCGNGVALQRISDNKIDANLYGIDFTQELIDIANKRGLFNCQVFWGDARNLKFENNFFHLIYSERCIINILDWEGQKKAIQEIYRVLKPGGKYLMIECFTDGLNNNNKAREECGLLPLKERNHNLYFEKEKTFEFLSRLFDFIDLGESFQPNFLSSHYFIARVLHPLITRGEKVQNTEFVKFFSYLPPIGNYSPLQAYVLRKK